MLLGSLPCPSLGLLSGPPLLHGRVTCGMVNPAVLSLPGLLLVQQQLRCTCDLPLALCLALELHLALALALVLALALALCLSFPLCLCLGTLWHLRAQ